MKTIFSAVGMILIGMVCEAMLLVVAAELNDGHWEISSNKWELIED